MRKSKLHLMLLIPLSIALSNCGHITVYDREVCADVGTVTLAGQKIGAHCAHTLTNATRNVLKTDWDKQRVGMLCMTSQAYTDAETAIDQFCNQYNVCDYRTREALIAAFARVNSVMQKGLAARQAYDLQLSSH